MKITRALISVSDKTGVAEFARALETQGVDIISTGGTAELLRKEQVPVRDISSFTDYPEVLEGRVKTLHPRVHGGLLYKRGNELHEAAGEGAGVPADRSRGGESLSLRGDDREAGCDARAKRSSRSTSAGLR